MRARTRPLQRVSHRISSARTSADGAAAHHDAGTPRAPLGQLRREEPGQRARWGRGYTRRRPLRCRVFAFRHQGKAALSLPLRRKRFAGAPLQHCGTEVRADGLGAAGAKAAAGVSAATALRLPRGRGRLWRTIDFLEAAESRPLPRDRRGRRPGGRPGRECRPRGRGAWRQGLCLAGRRAASLAPRLHLLRGRREPRRLWRAGLCRGRCAGGACAAGCRCAVSGLH
mmetsp:Transcript_138068/g.441075  ORF Transcript_138068/g.441075 Transcript_138068/m.441075 type:complete len:227 (-) Transcript_138068:450-1130(-)